MASNSRPFQNKNHTRWQVCIQTLEHAHKHNSCRTPGGNILFSIMWLILLSNYFNRFAPEWNQYDNNINYNIVRSQKYSNEVEIVSIFQKQDMGHRALKTYYQTVSHGRKPVMGELFPPL